MTIEQITLGILICNLLFLILIEYSMVHISDKLDDLIELLGKKGK